MRLNELEIKIAIDSKDFFQEVHASCMRLFGSPTSHFLQLDEYYDTPDGQLKKQDLVVRIRSTGDQTTIALKSPRMELPSGITNRIELEFSSTEGNLIHTQLLSQGLKPSEAAEKERWTYIHKDCEIVLDRLPFIGMFVEIEGPSEAAIKDIVAVLNLVSCPVVRQNYGELLRTKFRELQLPLTNICATFAKEKELMLG